MPYFCHTVALLSLATLPESLDSFLKMPTWTGWMVDIQVTNVQLSSEHVVGSHLSTLLSSWTAMQPALAHKMCQMSLLGKSRANLCLQALFTPCRVAKVHACSSQKSALPVKLKVQKRLYSSLMPLRAGSPNPADPQASEKAERAGKTWVVWPQPHTPWSGGRSWAWESDWGGWLETTAVEQGSLRL